MKKVLTFVLIFALGLTFAGCTQEPEGMSDAEAVADATTKLSLNVSNALEVKSNIELTLEGLNETVISWASNNEAVIAVDGTVTRPAIGEADVVVILTATITKGDASETKDFRFKVVASVPSTTITVVELMSDAIEVGQAVELEGVVVGTIAGKGFHFYDGTGFSYVYQGVEATPAIGDQVTIEGVKSTYYHTIQVSGSASFGDVVVTVNESGVETPEFTETSTTEIYNEYPALTHIYNSMVSFNAYATLEVDGDKTNIFVSWYDRHLNLETIEVYYKSGDLDIRTAIGDLDGHLVDVEAIVMDYYESSLSRYRINTNELGSVTDLGTPSDQELANLTVAFADITVGDVSGVDFDLTLPTTISQTGQTITWTTSDAAVITTAGVITQTEGQDEVVTLTATTTVGSATATKDYVVTVLDANKSIPLTVTDGLLEGNGASVLVQGVVTSFDYSNRPTIQDEFGQGIFVKDLSNEELKVGDEIIVRGTLYSESNSYGDTDWMQLRDATLVDVVSMNNDLVETNDTYLPADVATNYLDLYSATFDLTLTYIETKDIGGFPYVVFEGFTSDTETDIPLTISADMLPGFDDLYNAGETVDLTVVVYDYNYDTVRLNVSAAPELTEAEMLTIVGSMIDVPTEVTENLTLPTEFTEYGATVVWTSSNSAIGVDGTVTQPGIGEDDATGDLVATVTLGSETPLVLTFTVTVPALEEPPTMSPLFFSEYGDGPGGNCKYVEVYNPTNYEVDLSSYSIIKGGNGTAFGDSTNIEVLTGTLGAGEVLVIGNPGCLDTSDAAHTEGNPAFPLTGITFVESTVVGYVNGDDALGLFFLDTLIDSIGLSGEDPGSEWPVGNGNLTDGDTSDTILLRVPSVIAGTPDWAVGAMQWIVVADARDYSNVGVHTMDATAAAPLFFSEYGDGPGGNCKYVEVYNPSAVEVDLSYFSIIKGGNGTAFEDSTNIEALSGTLAAGGVLVIGNPGCLDTTDAAHTEGNPAFPLTGITFVSSTVVGYINGDDALGLFFGDVLVDSIGLSGEDPGSEWPVGNGNITDGDTSDTILIRIPTVMSGETDWTVGATQWIVVADARDYSDVGVHTYTPAP